MWETKEEAQKHCPYNYSVYGVMADWANDTVKNQDEDWNDLLVDSNLVKV